MRGETVFILKSGPGTLLCKDKVVIGVYEEELQLPRHLTVDKW